MARTATWTRIGKDVSTVKTIQDVLRESGLDYTVEKKPMFLGSGVEIPDKVATVATGTDRVLGVVSKKYEILQNADAFDFIDQVPGIQFERAGETKAGMVYVIGKLPGVTVLNDEFTPYVIFQTSHNGRYNIQATICPLRIVCQNQFAMSFKQMTNTIHLRHSSQLSTKIAQAQQLLIDAAQYMSKFKNTAEELAAIHITSRDSAYRIIDKFFDAARTAKDSDRQQKAMEERKEFFIDCYDTIDNVNFKGTAWGLINAYTDYTTHRQRKNTATAAESAFTSVTFDTAGMTKFIEMVRDNA